MRTLFLSRLSLVVLAVTGFHSSAFAHEGLSAAESNTLIKEDIAGTQILGEVCPALIGKQAAFEQNIQKLIQMNLQHYTGQNITFNTLQNDAEYKNLLIEARSAAKETTKDEQKSACEDVLNFEE